MSYRLQDILHETHDFWVLDVGIKGYQVYRKGITHSTKVASIGKSIGLEKAICECDRRQKELEEK